MISLANRVVSIKAKAIKIGINVPDVRNPTSILNNTTTKAPIIYVIGILCNINKKIIAQEVSSYKYGVGIGFSIIQIDMNKLGNISKYDTHTSIDVVFAPVSIRALSITLGGTSRTFSTSPMIILALGFLY